MLEHAVGPRSQDLKVDNYPLHVHVNQDIVDPCFMDLEPF